MLEAEFREADITYRRACEEEVQAFHARDKELHAAETAQLIVVERRRMDADKVRCADFLPCYEKTCLRRVTDGNNGRPCTRRPLPANEAGPCDAEGLVVEHLHARAPALAARRHSGEHDRAGAGQVPGL